MTIDRRRIWVSRMLLALMVLMTTATALHRHPEFAGEELGCEECLAHRPHAPHLSNGSIAIDDCLICQLANATFVVAAAIVITQPLCRTERLSFGLTAALQSHDCGHRRTRAPPML